MASKFSAVTQRDVAKELNVSVAAVSFALTGKPGLSDELRARVLAKADELGYRPNASAIALRTKRTRVLGLLMRNLNNPFFLDVIDGFDAKCAEAGYEILIGSSRYDVERERELVRSYSVRMVDGLAITPVGSGSPAEEWIDSTNRPAVLLNANFAVKHPRIGAVAADEELAVRLAAEHLFVLGHRRIAMFVPPSARDTNPVRTNVLLKLAAEWRFEAVLVTSEMRFESVRASATGVLRGSAQSRPTGLIANSDYTAQALYLAARDAGLLVPQDLSIVGHDNLPTSELLWPPLTTVEIDRRSLGERAATMLLDAVRHSGPSEAQTLLTPVDLIVRSSTAQAPRAGDQLT